MPPTAESGRTGIMTEQAPESVPISLYIATPRSAHAIGLARGRQDGRADEEDRKNEVCRRRWRQNDLSIPHVKSENVCAKMSRKRRSGVKGENGFILLPGSDDRWGILPPPRTVRPRNAADARPRTTGDGASGDKL